MYVRVECIQISSILSEVNALEMSSLGRRPSYVNFIHPQRRKWTRKVSMYVKYAVILFAHVDHTNCIPDPEVGIALFAHQLIVVW